MATQVSENQETDDYYATQAALGMAAMAAIRELWPALDPADILSTFPDLQAVSASIGAQHSLAGVSLAADYYEDHRLAQGVDSPFRIPVIEAPVPVQIEVYIEKATADLLAEVTRVADEILYAELATQLQAELEGSVAKVVGDAGRNQLIAAIEADREAKGWARVTRPDACSFCRMLATRGAIYKSERTANFRAHVPVNGRGGTCQCTVEPLFGAYEPPAHTRADLALWKKVTRNVATGDKANEFRRHLEGRADGPRRERGGQPKVTKAKPAKSGQPLGFNDLTPAQLRHHLAIVEALPASEYRTGQLERLRDRIAELGA